MNEDVVWAIFWISLAVVLSVMFMSMSQNHGEDLNKPIVEKCVANNGIPVYDKLQINKIIDCKIYK